MSMEAIRWAKQQKPKTATQRAVLMAIADYANETGLGWPSQKTLAEDMLLTDRTIRTALAGLEAAGLIVRISKRNPDGTRGVDRIQLSLTDELRQKAEARNQRKNNPVAQPAEISSKTTGKSFQNHRKFTAQPPEAVSAQEPSQGEPPVGNPHKTNVSEAIASGVPAIAVPPVEMSVKDRLWFEGKIALVETGMAEKLAGRMIGQWIGRYRDHARILDAILTARAQATQDALPLVVAILEGPNGRANAGQSKGRRSGMVSIALGELGRLH